MSEELDKIKASSAPNVAPGSQIEVFSNSRESMKTLLEVIDLIDKELKKLNISESPNMSSEETKREIKVAMLEHIKKNNFNRNKAIIFIGEFLELLSEKRGHMETFPIIEVIYCLKAQLTGKPMLYYLSWIKHENVMRALSKMDTIK